MNFYFGKLNHGWRIWGIVSKSGTFYRRWCVSCDKKKHEKVCVPRKPLERLLNYTMPYEKKSFEEHSDKRARHIWQDIQKLVKALEEC